MVFTGKGGVGTTTAAAATATLGALRGMRTLVMSTDAAHSLGDVLDAQIGPDPTEVDDGLYAQQIDAQRGLERSWSALGEPLTRALARLNDGGPARDGIHAEEATVIPGVEELMMLLEIVTQVRSKSWDLVVIDGAPTAHALRLLALPDTLMRYLRRLGGVRPLHALQPVDDGSVEPEPANALYRELSEVRELMTGPDATVRLVLTPEFVVANEARRAYTTLALYGYGVDGVIANRLFPQHGSDPWRRQWIAAQEVVLAEVEQTFDGTPIHRSPYRSCEPVGLGELAAFAAEAYGAADPFARPKRDELLRMVRDESGCELRFALPHVRGTDLAVTRKEDQLVLTVGSYRRVLTLPEDMHQAEVVGASLLDGQLVVRFRDAVERTGSATGPERGSLQARGGVRAAGSGPRIRHGRR